MTKAVLKSNLHKLIDQSEKEKNLIDNEIVMNKYKDLL